MNFKIYFMRKRLLFILPYLICVMAGLGLGYCIFGNKHDKVKKQAVKTYVYVGEKYEGLNFKRSAEYGFVPLDKINLSKYGVIEDAESAANVGIAMLSGMYGKENIESQKPFKVELINDLFWSVKGSLPPYAVGGTAFILIQKKDGRVLNYFHGK